MDLIKAKVAENQVLSEDNLPITADIAGAGKGESEGVVILHKDKAVYVPLNLWQDLESVIGAVSDLCDAISNNLENCIKGAATPNGAVTSAGTGLATLKSKISTVKSNLTTLKGKLK